MLLIPIAPQYELICFIYALAAIYLVAPIISAWLVKCTKRDIEIYLLIWSICLIIPYISIIIPEINEIIKYNGILHYFSGWLWIAVLGYYCRYYVKINKVKWYHFVFVFSIVPLTIVLFKIISGKTINNYSSLAAMISTAGVFLIIKDFNYQRKFYKQIELFLKLSFGIYLSHMLFIHQINLCISYLKLESYIQIPIIVIISGICSFAFVWLLSKLPFSRYIIG